VSTGPSAARFDRAWLLDAASYHFDDLPENARDAAWLVLCAHGTSFEILPDEPRFAKVADLTSESSEYGWEVTSGTCADPIVLLRGDGFQPGGVETVDIPGTTVAFHGVSYVLTDTDLAEVDALGVNQVRHELEAEGKSTVIGHLADWRIPWAGDLDHDGRLDLIVRQNEAARLTTSLFLSSAARNGQLVGKVAEIARGGC